MSDERTQTLYRVWRDSRQLVIDAEDGLPLVKYYDGAVITIPKYIVHIGNQEFETDCLIQAEKWLWNNWVRHEKGAGEI